MAYNFIGKNVAYLYRFLSNNIKYKLVQRKVRRNPFQGG